MGKCQVKGGRGVRIGKGVVYKCDGWAGSMVTCWLYGGMILELRECRSDANTEIQQPAIY